MVKFTPQPLYLLEKNSRYPVDRRLGGRQSRSGRHGEVKIRNPTGTRTPLYRLSYPGTQDMRWAKVCCLICSLIKDSETTAEDRHPLKPNGYYLCPLIKHELRIYVYIMTL
jgi:hypothetical protein